MKTRSQAGERRDTSAWGLLRQGREAASAGLESGHYTRLSSRYLPEEG
jgi:hypothetical protein